MSFTHLRCLNGYFYFRIRVPSDLEHVLGRREFQKTLHTKNPKTANKEVKVVIGKVEETFRFIRSGVLAPEQLEGYIESQFPTKKAKVAVAV